MKIFSILILPLLTLLSVCSCQAGSAVAEVKRVDIPGLTDLSISAASVEQLVHLERAKTAETNFRAQLLVADNGGSTDIHHQSRLYLTMMNESEMRNIESSHKIADINKLISHKKLGNHNYEAVVDFYDFDHICPIAVNKNLKRVMAIRIHAKQLALDIQNFKGLGRHDDGVANTKVTLEYDCL